MARSRLLADTKTDIIPIRKPLSWSGDSRDIVKEFADDARRRIGHQLDRVQCGLDPQDWKPMPSVGAGVREIRVRASGQFRVIYLATFADAVHVLHAFEKKSRKTARRDIELAASRLRSILADRKRKEGLEQP